MEPSDNPLINKDIKLKKFPGKGGWTYARLPDIPPVKTNPFGWRKVKGSIDNEEIRQYHLMPMGNGELFLPVKASIRKKIRKEAGDWVKIILFENNDPVEIPEEFVICLKDDAEAWGNFCRLEDQEQMKYIKWIYSAKSEGLRIQRMAEAINKISKNERL